MASQKDKKVLDFMFDPFLVEYSASGQEVKVLDESQEVELTTEQFEGRKLETKGVKLANDNKLNEALVCFDQAIQLWPTCSSIFNNRAQVYRLLNQIEDAKRDLNRAIELSDSETSRNRAVARQAYCQRALIHLLCEEKDQALKDMAKSAELGNKFARSYMAKMNPYAALCNRMLKEMFEQFQNPASDISK